MTTPLPAASDRVLTRLMRLHPKKIDLTLERVERLLRALGNPQDRLPPVIHVAGTNGKGSTVATMRACLEAAGYRVHVYTSPHLVRFHERLVELSGHLHVELRVCDPGAPYQKGGVERSIRYLKGSFFAARHIHSIEQGNQQLLSFLEETAATRPHPRLAGRTVADVFAEEQARLLPLPDVLPPLEAMTPTSVDAKAFVQLDTNRYSVPSKYASGTLSLVTTDTVVRLLDGDREVARHARSWGRKQTLEDPKHRTDLLQEKKAARDLKGRDRLVAEVPDIQTLFERWFEREFNLGSMVARTGKLLDSYGAAVLRAAVGDMLQRNLVDFGALCVLCEAHRKARGNQLVPPLHLADHVVDRDVVPHDLGGYDD